MTHLSSSLRLLVAGLPLLLLAGCPSPTTTTNPTQGPKTVTSPRTVVRAPGVPPLKAPVATPESLVNRQETLPDEVTYNGGFVQLTYSQAVLYSEKVKLPMMFYVYTQWCGPCKLLAEKVFPDPVFIEYMKKNMVALKVDAGEEEWRPIAEAMGVHSYPTMIVCEVGGSPIERFYAFHPTDEFLKFVNDYLNHVNTATWYKEQAEKNPDDMIAQLKAGKELAIRERGEEAIPFLQTVLDKDDVPNSVRVPEAMFLLAKTIYADQLKQRDKAIPLLDQLAQKFPTTYYGSEALYTLARLYLESKEMEKARQVLVERISTPDYDAVSFFRFGTFCQQYNVLIDEAISRVEKGISLHPESRFLVKTLADLHFRAGHYAKAVEIMEQLVKEEPNNDSYAKTLKNYKTVLERTEQKK